jgi:hypothetical protein
VAEHVPDDVMWRLYLLQASIQESMQRFSASLQSTGATFRQLAEAGQRIENQALFEHPDVMELDLADAAWNPDGHDRG